MATPIRQISRWLIVLFYLSAGLNHFRDPDFYYALIPDYLPFHEAINWISGVLEIVLGLGFIFHQTRRISAYVTLAMLIAFIPSHVYFIMVGSCIPDGLCVPPWVGWLRLVLIHPILMLWAWKNRN